MLTQRSNKSDSTTTFYCLLCALYLLSTVKDVLATEFTIKHSDPPEHVASMVEEYIRDRLGSKFIAWNVIFDYAQENPKDTWTLEYKFRVPDAPWGTGRARCTIHADSTVSALRERIGVPNCVVNPHECEFGVDQQKAFQIARDAGLEPGIEPWQPWFMFDSKARTYVWWVTTILSKSKYHETSRTIFIDANSGKVVRREPIVSAAIQRSH